MIVRLKDYRKRQRPVEEDMSAKHDPEDDMENADNQAKKDDSEEIDNTAAAGDEFLIWEPRSFFESISNFVQNMMESYLFLIVGIAAYMHPSMNSMIFMLLTTLLFHSMTKQVNERFKWNMLFLMVMTVYLVVVTITKLFLQA